MKPSHIVNEKGKRAKCTPPVKDPAQAPKRSAATTGFNFHTPAKLSDVSAIGKSLKQAQEILKPYSANKETAGTSNAWNNPKAPEAIMVDNEIYESEETLPSGAKGKENVGNA